METKHFALKQQLVLNTLMEYNGKINSTELSILLNWKMRNTLYMLNTLIKKGGIQRERKGIRFLYSLIDPLTAKIKIDTNISKKSSVSITEANLQERCYHYVLAGRSVSSIRVSDFFDISREQAMRLLKGLEKKYPDKIKVSMIAKVL